MQIYYFVRVIIGEKNSRDGDFQTERPGLRVVVRTDLMAPWRKEKTKDKRLIPA